MELFIVIALLVCYAIGSAVVNTINWYRERREDKNMAEEWGPVLDEIETRFDAIDVSSLEESFSRLKETIQPQLAVLETEHGKIVNRCPDCGDTLQVVTTKRYGKILGCPNYPKCCFLIKWSDVDHEMFEGLRIR